ncbi:bacteriohemerythrin [Dyella sp. EPa41]|uniref:bacteriohemerythrin n=1 Tax=Dyella sp. EPa41 TaxID=1561194 RepID=UPI0019151CCC|nr:bacteriohemerythrin [Dyella sp. EPa41]
MSRIEWQDDLDTGIEVIDHQHRRMVDMANAVCEAQARGDQTAIGGVLEGLLDYTLSHFTFEEALMEDAGYEFTDAHKRVHQVYAGRIEDYRRRFRSGEDISEELRAMLLGWLFQHIRDDDWAYVDSVKRNILKLTGDTSEGSWLATALRRFFGAGK